MLWAVAANSVGWSCLLSTRLKTSPLKTCCHKALSFLGLLCHCCLAADLDSTVRASAMSCECSDELKLIPDLQADSVVPSSTYTCTSSSWPLRIQYIQARMKDKVEATRSGAHLFFKTVRVPQAPRVVSKQPSVGSFHTKAERQ